MNREKIGIVVVTHGDAGAAMVASLRALLGPQATEGIETVSVAAQEPRESVLRRIEEGIARLGETRDLLLLCDLQGSTPANCCVELKQCFPGREVLCGVSLPMLIKIASANRAEISAAQLAHEAAETAIRSVRLGEGGEP